MALNTDDPYVHSRWANGLGYVKFVYDDVTLVVDHVLYQNMSARGPAEIDVVDKQGRVRQTVTLPPLTPEQTMDVSAMRLDFDPNTGGLDRWKVNARGPGQ